MKDCYQTLKLADFGVEHILERAGIPARALTAKFIPPELLEFGIYDQRSDVWLLGLVVQHMATLQLPPVVSHLAPLIPFSTNLCLQDYNSNQIKGILALYSKDLRDLIQLLLDADPRKRPTVPMLETSSWLGVEITAVQFRSVARKTLGTSRSNAGGAVISKC